MISRSARKYATHGWRVFPCHGIVGGLCDCGGDCGRSSGKHPRTAHGLRDASTDLETIAGWWDTWPTANVAVTTGPGSGIWVLDVDGPRGRQTMGALERRYGVLPQTVTATTGEGLHLYWVWEEGVRSQAGVAAGVDIKGEGGYVIAPPSAHKTGAAYEWYPERAPSQIALAQAPEWVLALARGQLAGRDQTAQATDLAETLAAQVPEGQRNVTCAKIAGALYRDGLSRPVVEQLLLGWNRLRCSPGLSEREIRRVAESIERTRQRREPDITAILKNG